MNKQQKTEHTMNFTRQVTLDAVVGQIRSDQWPAGYEPLIVVGAVVNGGLQKNIRWLTTHLLSRKRQISQISRMSQRFSDNRARVNCQK